MKKRNVIICGKCKKERNLPSHHFGNWYCEYTATVSFQEWRNELLSRGYVKQEKTRIEMPPTDKERIMFKNMKILYIYIYT